MFIYFIREGDDGPVKIGRAKDPYKRIKTLQIGHPRELKTLRLLAGEPELERVLHAHYKSHHIRGEWFQFCPTMLNSEWDIKAEASRHVKTFGRHSSSVRIGQLSHADILKFWPNRTHFTRDLNLILSSSESATTYSSVLVWGAQDYIPARYWDAIVALAVQQGHAKVTMEALQDAPDHIRIRRLSGRPRKVHADQPTKLRRPRGRPRKRAAVPA